MASGGQGGWAGASGWRPAALCCALPGRWPLASRCLTRAAAISRMSVGSCRLPTHSLKKFLGGMALKRLAPKAALRTDAPGDGGKGLAPRVPALAASCSALCTQQSRSQLQQRAPHAAPHLRASRPVPSRAVGSTPSCNEVQSAAATPCRPPSASHFSMFLFCVASRWEARGGPGSAAGHRSRQARGHGCLPGSGCRGGETQPRQAPRWATWAPRHNRTSLISDSVARSTPQGPFVDCAPAWPLNACPSKSSAVLDVRMARLCAIGNAPRLVGCAPRAGPGQQAVSL